MPITLAKLCMPTWPSTRQKGTIVVYGSDQALCRASKNSTDY